jgi:hypothetical protein
MRSASIAAALLLSALLAVGGAAVSGGPLPTGGSEAGFPGGSGEPLPLVPNLSFPERTVAAQVWYERGLALTTEGRYAQAVTAYRNALAADRSHLNAWYYLGDALFRLGRYGEALLAFRNATAVDPDFVDAYFYEGRVYGKLGMPAEEKEALGRGLDAADRRSAAEETETRGTGETGEAVPQPLPLLVPVMGAGIAAALLWGSGRRARPP